MWHCSILTDMFKFSEQQNNGNPDLMICYCLFVLMKCFTSHLALSDPGKRRHGSGEAKPTIPTPQEEAQSSGWAWAFWVRRICWFHGAEARSHGRIQHSHRRWWNRDKLCCAEYPAGRNKDVHVHSYFIIIITLPVSLFSKRLQEMGMFSSLKCQKPREAADHTHCWWQAG